MGIETTIGIISGVASIMGLLIQAPNWKSRFTHALYGLLVALFCGGYVYYKQEVLEIKRIEVQAKSLLDSADFSSDGSCRGFMLAAFAFLEKNRNQTPDTYLIAKGIMQGFHVTESKEEDGMDRLHQSWRLQDGASALQSLLKGIAAGGVS
jgi:hypothetical protein